jgi:hypothetical protein
VAKTVIFLKVFNKFSTSLKGIRPFKNQGKTKEREE